MSPSLALTATIITYNEERNIRACLESIAWVPNIVVIDSGSTDATVQIAHEFGCQVKVLDWPGHVQQKNRAIDYAGTDWIFSLDADERCTPELRAAVESAFAGDIEQAQAYSVRRKTRYLGQWILHGGWYPDRKLRLFNRRYARWGGTNPHDHIMVEGNTQEFAADLLHYTYRDMHHHLEVIDFFTDIAAYEKDLAGKKRPLWGMLVRPPFKFFKMYLLKKGYRDGFAGFILAALGAYYVFLKDAKLWERRQLKKRGLQADNLPRFQRGPEWRPPRQLSESNGNRTPG